MKQTLIERIKTWLFLASVLALVLGPAVVSSLNRQLDARFQTGRIAQAPEQNIPAQECVPAVDPATYATLDTLLIQDDDTTISLRMAELFLADQAARQLPAVADPQQVSTQDALRRVKVLDYITSGQIHAPRNLFYAAFIFQHGDCPEHYRLGHRLAQAALEAGYSDARWIYAATLDRYLMSLGELQKYGTQYTWIDGEFKLYPVDPTTTDAERATYNVPPLTQALNQKPVGVAGGIIVRQRCLETWRLTWIGAGFAVLCYHRAAGCQIECAPRSDCHNNSLVVVSDQRGRALYANKCVEPGNG